ncbi:hypothetical protein KI387_027494, partial [Taxus chinensis]
MFARKSGLGWSVGEGGWSSYSSLGSGRVTVRDGCVDVRRGDEGACGLGGIACSNWDCGRGVDVNLERVWS